MTRLAYVLCRIAALCCGSQRLGALSRGELESVMALYAHQPWHVRAHVGARAATLSDVLRHIDALPDDASVLDVGCGYGFASHWAARVPTRQVVGIDASAGRVAIATSVASRGNPSFRVEVVENATGVATSLDGVLCVDVLLYLAQVDQERLLAALRCRSTDQSRLIVKDTLATPKWKLAWTRAEERIKLRAGLYGGCARGTSVTYRTEDDWRDCLTRCGWRVVSLHRHGHVSPYPGFIAVCHAG
ncbi:methyltransferase domain-containing protein [Candidatus Poribacteria bacterium]|nr:methyltransferase domain-containing protein [Candidatus Poribacteria bacterium]